MSVSADLMRASEPGANDVHRRPSAAVLVVATRRPRGVSNTAIGCGSVALVPKFVVVQVISMCAVHVARADAMSTAAERSIPRLARRSAVAPASVGLASRPSARVSVGAETPTKSMAGSLPTASSTSRAGSATVARMVRRPDRRTAITEPDSFAARQTRVIDPVPYGRGTSRAAMYQVGRSRVRSHASRSGCT